MTPPTLAPPKRFHIPVITTIKSILFHPLFKYVFLPKTNPLAIILIKNSSINIIVIVFPTIFYIGFSGLASS